MPEDGHPKGLPCFEVNGAQNPLVLCRRPVLGPGADGWSLPLQWRVTFESSPLPHDRNLWCD